MEKIKLIAFDLDGTLLHEDKTLSPRTLKALEQAAALGIELVPATGRFFGAMPDAVRALPFVHYAITINGAQVLNVQQGFSVARAEMTAEGAVEIMRYLDALPVLYDAIMDDWGTMTRSHYDRVKDFALDDKQFHLIYDHRTPVDDLKSFILARGRGVQKTQLYTKDAELRARLLRELPERFPWTAVSSSVNNNVEINDAHANKGAALKNLANYLGVSLARTMAFGDGLNDIPMLQAAGVGVAMGNAYDEVKAVADYETLTCDEDGVAVAIEKFCFAS